MLTVSGVHTFYGNIEALKGVDIEVGVGEIVTIIGANGAGKSSTLRVISGVNKLFEGSITVDGEEIGGASPAKIARRGVVHVPENRRVFPANTVEENLRLGAYPIRRTARERLASNLEMVYERFPRLAERRTQLAGTMSGGEQQILAIGMGLMAEPKVLMLDEPSLGLAPIYVENVFEEIRALKEAGTTILLVEQLAKVALAVADRGVVLQYGEVVAEGTSAELMANARVVEAYLGSD